TVGDGVFPMPVNITNSGMYPLKSVSCVTVIDQKQADQILALMDLPRCDKWSDVEDPFIGTPLSVDIWVTTRDGLFSHSRVQYPRLLVVIAECDDGKRLGKVVEIPDRRQFQSVSVDFP